MLLRLTVLLLTLSAVHGGLEANSTIQLSNRIRLPFDGIRNCRHSKCYITVSSFHVTSWSEKHCGHSCGTMQRVTPSLCRSSIGPHIPSDQAMCNSNTFRFGSGSGDKRLITATLNGKPDCRDGRDPSHWMN